METAFDHRELEFQDRLLAAVSEVARHTRSHAVGLSHHPGRYSENRWTPSRKEALEYEG
jgi:hypothetical protein